MSMKMKEDGVLRTMCKSKIKRLEMSKPESERDSGFSDASSEHLSTVDQTDTEDAGRTVISKVGASRSQPTPLAVVGGSFQSLSPMLIMNNVLVKQPGDNSPSLKPWGFSPAVEVVQQPQVVFLQPMVSQRTSTVPKGPPSKRRRHKKYFPILKSYPKIAPHPGDNQRSNCSSSSSSSSSTTGSVKISSLSSSSQEQPHREKLQSGLQTSASSGSSTQNQFPLTSHLAASPKPHVTLTDSTTGSCSDVETPANGRLELSAATTDTHNKALQKQIQTVSRDDICQSNDSDNSNKRKRFCNTYNILSKSGLLDITLRTKDLIRQNRRTQAELDQLRKHTNLFMEALQTGDLGIWSKLQLSMQEESEKEKTVNNGIETKTNQDTS